MTIVSSDEIGKRILDPDDSFNITPIFDWKKQISTSSVDLRLDNQFIVITRTTFSSINPVQRKNMASLISQYQKKVTVPYGQKFVLHPNDLVLGSTLEYLSFPDNLAAYVIGRSSWGRLGLIIATATTINPRFKGTLTLELVNVGNVPIELYPGVRIAQLIIHKIDGKENSYGKYQLQTGPGFSKIYKDEELDYLTLPKYKVIIGLTGHKGCGKSIYSSYLIEDKSYKYFSLSHIVRRVYGERKLGIPQRNELQDLGDELRLKHKPDYLARQIIREIKEVNLDNNSCILIDGIRNPAEVDLLSKLSNFYLIAIDTTKDKIMDNLRMKGYLIDDEKYKELEIMLEEEKDPEKKKELQARLHSCINHSQFDEAYDRDCGLSNTEVDKKGCGQNINACLEKTTIDNKLQIDSKMTVIEALNKFKDIIQKLE